MLTERTASLIPFIRRFGASNAKLQNTLRFEGYASLIEGTPIGGHNLQVCSESFAFEGLKLRKAFDNYKVGVELAVQTLVARRRRFILRDTFQDRRVGVGRRGPAGYCGGRRGAMWVTCRSLNHHRHGPTARSGMASCRCFELLPISTYLLSLGATTGVPNPFRFATPKWSQKFSATPT